MNLDEQHFLEALGLRLRARREELKWTQEDLAHQCGLHRTFIGSVERGERNVAILNLRRIAKTLRVPVTELFEGAAKIGVGKNVDDVAFQGRFHRRLNVIFFEQLREHLSDSCTQKENVFRNGRCTREQPRVYRFDGARP